MSFIRPIVQRTSTAVLRSSAAAPRVFAPRAFFATSTTSTSSKMSSVSASQIKEHMKVVGSDSTEVGTVDHMQGEKTIKLTKGSGTTHHYIPLDWVKSVDSKVTLSKPAKDVEQQWSSNPPPS